MEIDAAELVVGDLVLLAAGDRVAADLAVVESPRPAHRQVDAHRRERPRARRPRATSSSPAPSSSLGRARAGGGHRRGRPVWPGSPP